MKLLKYLHRIEKMATHSGLIANSGAGGRNALDVLRLLADYILALHMHLLTINKHPYIGVSAKGGNEKGEILKDQQALKQVKAFAVSLIKEIENERKSI